MQAIIIPLIIIALLVGFYYMGDIWKGAKTSIPFFEDGKFQLPESKDKFIPPSSPDSPLRNLK